MNPHARRAILTALAIGTLHATLAPRMSLDEMVERSERILQGRCLRAWTAWDAKHQFIWTHSEIQVLDSLKGGPAATVVVSEPGGAVGDEAMWIAGMPQYRPGEEVVLFLYRVPNGMWRARGLGQGKFQVLPDGRVRADLGGVEIIDRIGAVPSGTDLRSLDGLGLADLKNRVRGLLLRPSRGDR